MLVSVIMSAYNEPVEWLEAAIESIINQSYKNLELILIIDNPENNDLIQVGIKYKNLDNRVNLVVNEVNLGLVKSLNSGLTIANGNYICRMDADDISSPERLSIQLDYLLKNNIDILGGGRTIISEEGNVKRKYTSHPTGYLNIHYLLREKDIVFHPTWLAKKEVFTTLGNYREIDAAEDYDFLVRAINIGFKVDNIDSEVLLYRDRDSSISNMNSLKQVLTSYNIQKAFRRGKNLDLVYLENYLSKIDFNHETTKFQLGMDYLRETQSLIGQKKYFSGIKKLIVIPFYSKYALLYLYMRVRFNIALRKVTRK